MTFEVIRKNCKECKDDFAVERISQVFCDRSCAKKWHNRDKKKKYAEAKRRT